MCKRIPGLFLNLRKSDLRVGDVAMGVQPWGMHLVHELTRLAPRGFAVLRSMAPVEPDEIVFNSLLDGCAKQQRVDDVP